MSLGKKGEGARKVQINMSYKPEQSVDGRRGPIALSALVTRKPAIKPTPETRKPTTVPGQVLFHASSCLVVLHGSPTTSIHCGTPTTCFFMSMACRVRKGRRTSSYPSLRVSWGAQTRMPLNHRWGARCTSTPNCPLFDLRCQSCLRPQ